jgi:hypothetical protein
MTTMNDTPTPLARIVIDKDLYAALKRLQRRDGITPTEATRRALKRYLVYKDMAWAEDEAAKDGE